ncbi:MAG: RDD family protein [Desulfosoma sp.]
MYCTQCGSPVPNGARFCGSCGAPLQHASAAFSSVTPASITPSKKVVPQIRPWVRYWARMLDLDLFSLVGGYVIGIFAPQAYLAKRSEYLIGLTLLFIWTFVESALITTFGTTPGKWLLKVRLTRADGLPISYSEALSRSIKVWWRGLGTGFPIAVLITLIIAHRRLKRNGVTSWDKEGGFVVMHEKIGVGRALATIVLIIAFTVLWVLGSIENV